MLVTMDKRCTIMAKGGGWKNVERLFAARLGGERVPVTGRTGAKGMESPDIMHERYSIEIKMRDPKAASGAGLPKWLQHAHEQAQASRKPYHLAAISIIHHKNQRLSKAMVQMSFEDFLKLDALLSAEGS